MDLQRCALLEGISRHICVLTRTAPRQADKINSREDSVNRVMGVGYPGLVIMHASHARYQKQFGLQLPLTAYPLFSKLIHFDTPLAWQLP